MSHKNKNDSTEMKESELKDGKNGQEEKNVKNGKGRRQENGKAEDKFGDELKGQNKSGDAEAAKLSGDLEDSTTRPWKVPDGGWGWVIVVCALMVSLIVDGLSYTFGILLGDLEKAFQQPKSTIALASSLQVGIYLFIGPIVSILTNIFGCRPIIIAGSIVASAAFIMSAWSTNVIMLILTYGVIGGVGFGLMYLPAIVAVSIYFEERRALATGIAVCGSGIGTFLLAPFTKYLLYEYNWNWTLLILGGLILNGIVFGALVRPLELQKDNAKKNGDEEMYSHENDSSKLGDGDKTEGKSLQENKINPNLLPEQVPLMSAVDEQNKIVVPPVPNTGNKGWSLLFSSTPNMFNRSLTHLNQVDKSKSTRKSSETGFTNIPEGGTRARANTLDRPFLLTPAGSSHDKAAPVPAHARAPIGLAFISLSDANINKIREDIHLPLPRKDIHLSGPLSSADSKTRLQREEASQGVYIQSRRSISSVSTREIIQVAKPGGLWSCLPDSARETMEEMLDLRILKDKRYWFVLMGNFFCMVGFYVPFVYIPEMAEFMGMSEDQAAFLVSIIGITNTAGRVLTGIVINFLNIDCVLVTSVALAIAGVMTIVCPMCVSYPALATVSAIFGVCVAAYISLCSVILCDLLGVENLTNAFGFVILFRGIACIMGPPIAGAIIQATGQFDPSFYMGGSMIILGAVSHAFLLLPACRRTKSKDLRD